MPLSSRHEVTVEWGDCDPAGIVYYPSYFKWFDQATYRLFLAAGLKRDDVSSGQWKEGTPSVAAQCSFRRASQHGEKLVMESHIEIRIFRSQPLGMNARIVILKTVILGKPARIRAAARA